MTSRTLATWILMIIGFGSMGWAQECTGDDVSPPAFSSFYAPIGYRVTIETEGGLVSVFDVPPGAYLNVEVKEPQDVPQERKGLPVTFRGNLTLRTRSADDFSELAGRSMTDVMSEASMTLTIKDAVVNVKSRR